MGREEHFYTVDFFQQAGINPFLQHIEEYLTGLRTVPVSRTTSQNKGDIFFTFSDELLQQFDQNSQSMKKPYEVAIKYGFRGYSAGGKNGIFFLRDGDDSLSKSIDRYLTSHGDTVRQDLDVDDGGYEELRKVKIVWHNSSAERVVGVYNTQNHRMMFVDLAQY